MVDKEIQKILGADVIGVYNDPLLESEVIKKEDDEYLYIVDNWGLSWKKPKMGGLYYDLCRFPLMGAGLSDLKKMRLPNPINKERLNSLTKKAKNYYENTDYYIALGCCGMVPGYFQILLFECGFEDGMIRLVSDRRFTNKFLDKMEDLEMEFWQNFLPMAGKWLNMLMFTDDFGGQNGLLISKEIIKKYFLIRYKRLFSIIKGLAPNIKIFFHSCGSIYEIIEDLIEVGVDILNPIQIDAKGMELKKLKKNFGNDIVFWGGGIDTHNILNRGTPREVKESIKSNIEALAPNGGFIFNTVHNIQEDVPPENIITMIETVKEYGKY